MFIWTCGWPICQRHFGSSLWDLSYRYFHFHHRPTILPSGCSLVFSAYRIRLWFTSLVIMSCCPHVQLSFWFINRWLYSCHLQIFRLSPVVDDIFEPCFCPIDINFATQKRCCCPFVSTCPCVKLNSQTSLSLSLYTLWWEGHGNAFMGSHRSTANLSNVLPTVALAG